jgi:hypothetical protein
LTIPLVLSINLSSIFTSKINLNVREIQNCDGELTDSDWFAQILKIKKKLKKAEENAKKKGTVKPLLTKKPSIHLEFPQQLF